VKGQRLYFMSTNPFDKFDGQAQGVLTASYQILMHARHSQLDVEHLLMALLMQPQGFATLALEQLKVDRGLVLLAVEQSLDRFPQRPDAPNTSGINVSMYFSPRLQQIFSQAASGMQQNQAEFITPRDLLLAITASPDDPAANLLKGFGLEQERLAQIQPENPVEVKLPLENPVQAGQPSESAGLTHFNESGRARMVDVSEKDVTGRRAIARGEIRMLPETLALIREGRAKKGDVLAVAQVAGIMAAKKTSEIIPMCHPLMLTGVDLRFEYDLERSAVLIEAEAKTSGQTGVEMEALTAVSAAALTIYDMVKATDKGMQIEAIRLAHKSGGKSGIYQAE
jgi:cyclic pyranopterin phosphate synthase